MNLNQLQTHGLSPEKAFETLCNQLFENYCRENYNNQISYFRVINGAGGDGGVESYATLNDGSIVGLQAKWFLQSIENSQFTQIKNSIISAMNLRSQIKQYIVCIPRDLADLTGRNDVTQSIIKTEVNRWNKIKSDIEDDYPGLSLEIWTEYDLIKELQKASNQGALKYWFGNSTIGMDTIRLSLNKQRAGWLSRRFFEDLHINGILSEKINYFLGDDIVYAKEIKHNERFIVSAKKLLDEIDDFLTLKKIKSESKATLLDLRNIVVENISILEKINNAYSGKISERIDSHNSYINKRLIAYLDNLKDEEYHYLTFIYSIKRLVEKLEAFEFQFENSELLHLNKLIVLGDRGTGKTHGVVNKIIEINDGNKHIGILIQASIIGFGSGWKDVLINSLGLAATWSEEELFGALESMAHSNDTLQKNLDSDIKSKVLICIDGLDEKRPYDYWASLISQTEAISARFQRIKFCFTSRPYVFKYDEISSFENPVRLYNSDVSVSQLFDKYINHYNIEIGDKNWIRWHLKTPIMLRLFCEQYAGKKVDNRLRDDAFVVSLFNEKIKKIESEFCVQNTQFVIDNEIICKSLLCLAEYFIDNKDITENDAYKILEKVNLKNGGLNVSQLVINFLCETGLLWRYVDNANSLTKRVTKIYINSQPIFDYIFALLIYDKIDEIKGISFNLTNNRSIMELLAVMLFPKRDLEFFKCELFKEVRDIFHYQCYVMLNCPKAVTSNHLEGIKRFMLKNTANFMSIVSNIILDAARIKDHPFGAKFLSSILCEFKTPIERDLFFALPTKWTGYSGYKDYKTKWDYESEFLIMDKQYSLSPDDKYDGLPLIYAWALSLLENEKRTHVRNSLYKWSICAPQEFVKLFLTMKDVNDPQIRADMFSVAMSMAYELPADNSAVGEIAHIVFKDVFADGNLSNNRDMAIRFYSEQICEKAFYGKHLSKEQIKVVRSKKVKNNEKLILHTKAFKTGHCDSYGEFNYDLTRYVLCDPISTLFFERAYHKNKSISGGEKLLNEYAKEYGVKEIAPSGFIIAAAYQFFIDSGYSKKLCEVTHEDGKKTGIAYKYGGASHGSKSSIYSIAEKYARRAKYYILGYLADALIFTNHSTGKLANIKRYTDMENFIVPYQEVIELHKSNMDEEIFIIPQQLNRIQTPRLGKTPEDVSYNIKNTLAPDFKEFLHISGELNSVLAIEKKQYTVLHQLIHSHAENFGIETTLWISSGFINRDDFSCFIKDVQNGDESIVRDIVHPDKIHAYTEAYCYLNPSDICMSTMTSEATFELINKANKKYKIFYASEKCTSSIDSKGDVEYILPSIAIRNYCGIIKGNGYDYLDAQNNKIAIYYSIGELFGDMQNVLAIDTEALSKYLSENNLMMFWLCRVFAKISTKTSYRLDKNEYTDDKDETYIVWFDKSLHSLKINQ